MVTAPDPNERDSGFKAARRGREPVSFEDRLLRTLARAPAWLASAAIHGVVFGILLQITALTGPVNDTRNFRVGLTDREDKALLDQGTDTLDEAVPVMEPLVDPATFEWDENQTESTEAFEDFALDAELPNLIALYGGYGQRTRGGRTEAVRRGGGTQGSEEAVELALEWLQRHQGPDGGWHLREYTARCIAGAECAMVRDPLRGADPGVTGLATLAYLGGGYTGQRGRFRQIVDAALEYLLRVQGRDGCFGQETGSYCTYNHAICTLAVSEAYGMTQNLRYRAAAEKGIKYTLKTQHVDGGWGYMRKDIGEFKSDVSVTGWHVMALKSAEMAGIKIPKGTWKSITEYVAGASDARGLAGYTQANQFVTPLNPSTIAVGLLCLQFAPGGADSEKAANITDFLVRALPSVENEGFFYYAYYGSLSLYQYGGPKWKTWNVHVRDLLVKRQEKEGCEAGSWEPGTRRWASWAGRIYSTAMAALTLEVYYRYLPLAIHRGHADATPQAIALDKYRKALKAYRHYIELSGNESTPPEKCAEARDRAIALLEEYREAATGFNATDRKAAQERKTRLAATTIRLATVHLRSDRYARCAEVLKDFSEKYPEYEDQETPRKLYASALALVARKLDREGGQLDAERLRRAAVEDYYRRIVRDPDQPLAVYMQVAEDFYAREDWFRGAAIFSQLIERFADASEVRKSRWAMRLKLAKCLLKSGQSTDALKLFEELCAEARCAAALEGLADCYVQTRDFEGALRIYLQLRAGSRTGSTEWWQAQYNVANTLMLTGRTEECKRLIAAQKVLRPGLGGPEMAAKFQDLLRLCQRIDSAGGPKSGM